MYPASIADYYIKQCSHNGKYSARRTHEHYILTAFQVYVEGCCICNEAAAKIEQCISHRSQQKLQMLPKHIEKQHIVQKMPDSGVQEHGGQKTPVLSMAYKGNIGGTPANEDRCGQRTAGEDFCKKEDGDIYDDQSRCYGRYIFTRDCLPPELLYKLRYYSYGICSFACLHGCRVGVPVAVNTANRLGEQLRRGVLFFYDDREALLLK